MPVWAELAALMLAGYAVGLAAGWILWGRTSQADAALSDKDL